MRLLLLFFLGIFSLSLCGQNRAIDSLKQELKKNLVAEKKLDLNKELGKVYLEGQVYMDSAVFYLRQAEQIAKKNKMETPARAETLFRLGHAYGMSKKWDKSLQYFKESATYAEKLNLDNSLISARQNIAKIHMETAQFELAKDAYLDIIELSEKQKKPKFVLTGYTNLAEIYLQENNLIKATEYILQAKVIAERNNLDNHYYHYTNASILLSLNELDKAEECAHHAEEMAKEENDLEYTFEASALLSKILEKKGNYEGSLSYLKQAVVFKDSIQSSHRLSEVDRMELQLQVQEQEASLAALKQRNKYLTTIYLLTALGILLLTTLILRQLKIVRMTKNIHEIQNSLVKHEMDQRKMNKSTFEATKKGDQEFLKQS